MTLLDDGNNGDEGNAEAGGEATAIATTPSVEGEELEEHEHGEGVEDEEEQEGQSLGVIKKFQGMVNQVRADVNNEGCCCCLLLLLLFVRPLNVKSLQLGCARHSEYERTYTSCTRTIHSSTRITSFTCIFPHEIRAHT